jgi:hypothetical protein
MKCIRCNKGLLALASSALATAAFGQITLGHVDTFQDGTVMNWSGGAVIENVDGGPAGPGDRYFQITSSGGGGAGSRLACFNDFQWSGNYIAAGVTSIRMHMRNQSGLELNMRLALWGTSFSSQFTSTNPIVIAPGTGWQIVTFSLAQSDLTRVLGTGTYTQVMTNVNRFHIRHQTGPPGNNGSAIEAQIGVDNITAVPEPASVLAIGMGLAALYIRKRKA